MKKMIVFLIRGHQFLSPIRHQIMKTLMGHAPVCRHSPSCSMFTIQQIQKHGTIIGLKRGFQRILTCY